MWQYVPSPSSGWRVGSEGFSVAERRSKPMELLSDLGSLPNILQSSSLMSAYKGYRLQELLTSLWWLPSQSHSRWAVLKSHYLKQYPMVRLWQVASLVVMSASGFGTPIDRQQVSIVARSQTSCPIQKLKFHHKGINTCILPCFQNYLFHCV